MGMWGCLQADRTPSFSSIFMLGFLSEANHAEPLPPAPLPQQCTITTQGVHCSHTQVHSYRQTDRQTDFLTISVGNPLC